MEKPEIFIRVEELINNGNQDEKIELEVAAQIDTDMAGHQTIYPGIEIIVPGHDMPIFIANEELIQLAKASQAYFDELMAQKKVKKSKL